MENYFSPEAWSIEGNIVILEMPCFRILDYGIMEFAENNTKNTTRRAATCIQYRCYEMDKTSIFMFEILEPGGSALGKYSI